MYQSGYENTYYENSYYFYLTASVLHTFTPDIKIIFKVKPDLALSLDFQLNLTLNKFMTAGEMPPEEIKLKASYKIILYAAWAVDFH